METTVHICISRSQSQLLHLRYQPRPQRQQCHFQQQHVAKDKEEARKVVIIRKNVEQPAAQRVVHVLGALRYLVKVLIQTATAHRRPHKRRKQENHSGVGLEV